MIIYLTSQVKLNKKVKLTSKVTTLIIADLLIMSNGRKPKQSIIKISNLFSLSKLIELLLIIFEKQINHVFQY